MSISNILIFSDLSEGVKYLEKKIEFFDLVEVHLHVVKFYFSISEIRNKSLNRMHWIYEVFLTYNNYIGIIAGDKNLNFLLN